MTIKEAVLQSLHVQEMKCLQVKKIATYFMEDFYYFCSGKKN